MSGFLIGRVAREAIANKQKGGFSLLDRTRSNERAAHKVLSDHIYKLEHIY
jgi:hypothetical protein